MIFGLITSTTVSLSLSSGQPKGWLGVLGAGSRATNTGLYDSN